MLNFNTKYLNASNIDNPTKSIHYTSVTTGLKHCLETKLTITKVKKQQKINVFISF